MYHRKKYLNSKQRAIAQGYRSGLEELNVSHLRTLGLDSTTLYEPTKIPYIIPESKHTYTPDFILPNGVIVETKGRFVKADRDKHLLLKKQYPEMDLRFVFSNSKTRIRKGSKTTYAIWCLKNDFLFADKLIPREWVLEKSK
jgi:hypothetical protein